MTRSPRILLAGGGTGGHVYPAIAIADAIRRANSEAAIGFAGTEDHIEWKAVPQAGYPIHPITAAGIRRRLTLTNLSVPFKMSKGLAQALRLVADFDADVVVGTGGFVSGPVGLAAAMRRRPLVLQEQNAFAGVTNRMLGRMARRVHVAFEEAVAFFPEGRTRVTGNPVRPDLAATTRTDAREALSIPSDALVLLVLGGSGGSRPLNEAVSSGIESLLADDRIHVIWQTGVRFEKDVPDSLRRNGRIQVMPYIDRMDRAYAAADLALCRSGASTCSELLVTGTPCILVPSPNVAEDHQTRNAEALVRIGAAVLLTQDSLLRIGLDSVRALLLDEPARSTMSVAAKDHAVTDAADRIAEDVLGLARNGEVT